MKRFLYQMAIEYATAAAFYVPQFRVQFIKSVGSRGRVFLEKLSYSVYV